MGTVYLVGAGPGAADLLTVRAARLLAAADVVLHDALIGDDVLALAPHAQKIAVGKRCGAHSTSQRFINKRLVDAARRAKVVVRLKGGDPMLFGRAHEEIEALAAAGIDCEIVPGVTARARRSRRREAVADAARGFAQCRVRDTSGGRGRKSRRLGEGCGRRGYDRHLHGGGRRDRRHHRAGRRRSAPGDAGGPRRKRVASRLRDPCRCPRRASRCRRGAWQRPRADRRRCRVRRARGVAGRRAASRGGGLNRARWSWRARDHAHAAPRARLAHLG